MYRHDVGWGLSCKMRSRMGRTAASVFPIPVGATNNTLAPARIRGIARSCGSVNDSIPRAETASSKRESSPRPFMRRLKGRWD